MTNPTTPMAAVTNRGKEIEERQNLFNRLWEASCDGDEDATQRLLQMQREYWQRWEETYGRSE